MPEGSSRAQLEAKLRSELSDRAASVLEEHPLEAYAEALEKDQIPGRYQRVPFACRRVCDDIERRYGQAILELYHRLLLVWLIGRSATRIADTAMSSRGRELTERFQRDILNQASSPRPGYYLHSNDQFSKDLGVCRLRLLPCGPELLDTYAGVRRSMLLRGGLFQFARGALLFGRARGFKPFYDLHFDRRLLGEFNEAGYDHCYFRVSELLERNPEIKGLSCSSWWYDPQVESISPELAFLRRRPADNGAMFFYFGTSQQVIEAATKFSPKRRALYDEGSYRPANYIIVWLRRDLLDWARRASNS